MGSKEALIMFPVSAITHLRGLRNNQWDQLIETVLNTSADSIETISFILMMSRLCGCLTCNSDSHRSMIGCTECGNQTVKRYKYDDTQLISLYEKNIHEIRSRKMINNEK